MIGKDTLIVYTIGTTLDYIIPFMDANGNVLNPYEFSFRFVATPNAKSVESYEIPVVVDDETGNLVIKFSKDYFIKHPLYPLDDDLIPRLTRERKFQYALFAVKLVDGVESDTSLYRFGSLELVDVPGGF